MVKRRKVEFRDGPSAYCQLCASMISASGLEQMASSTGFMHHKKSLCEESAKTGCSLCMLIVDNASTNWRDSDGLVFKSILSFRMSKLSEKKDNDDNGVREFDQLCGWSVPPAKFKSIVFLSIYTNEVLEVDSSLADPMSNAIPLRPVAINPATDETFATARAWIANCFGDHKTCHYTGETLLPSRVIDVGKDMRSQTVKLRISSEEEKGDYVALSYCWGGTQSVVLTANTLETMTANLDISGLPKTILDAIEVTQQLGFRFLWIDALCIMQDCQADKDKEIQRMGYVYKNAAITIVAAAAQGAFEGFLRLNRTQPPSCRFQFQLPDGSQSTVFVSRWGLFNPSHPLDSRGWALQEYLLSPRLLVYSEKELLWHCQTEKFKTITKSSLDYFSSLERLPPRVFDNNIRAGKSWTTQKQRVVLWKSIVEQYSNRLLTNKEDRLNALAGVARELGTMWKDDYIFGLWKQCFIELLAWRAAPSEHSTQRCRSSRAPSWSWASLDGSVNFQTMSSVQSEVSFDEENRMSIFLKCKSLPAVMLSRQGCSLWLYWDLVLEEGLIDQVQLLLLGEKKGKRIMMTFGIMAVFAGRHDRSLRRVGYFESYLDEKTSKMWEIESREFVIV